MTPRIAVPRMAEIVDVAAMMEADRDGTLAVIRDLRDLRLEPPFAAAGGELLKRLGDGWI